jgi:hypothetical protein
VAQVDGDEPDVALGGPDGVDRLELRLVRAVLAGEPEDSVDVTIRRQMARLPIQRKRNPVLDALTPGSAAPDVAIIALASPTAATVGIGRLSWATT